MKNHTTKSHKGSNSFFHAARIVVIGMGLALAAPHMANAQSVTPPPVPANLEVPAGNTPFLVGHALGTQNYACQPSDQIGHVAWTLFTPEATLFNGQEEQVLTHFFSPNPLESGVVRATWENSEDTSVVWGRVVASSTDPNFVAAGAVSWLLVQVVGNEAGPTGGNAFSGTTFVQRLTTAGGAAPSTGCSLPTDIGAKAFVPYTADYFFFKP